MKAKKKIFKIDKYILKFKSLLKLNLSLNTTPKKFS